MTNEKTTLHLAKIKGLSQDEKRKLAKDLAKKLAEKVFEQEKKK